MPFPYLEVFQRREIPGEDGRADQRIAADVAERAERLDGKSSNVEPSLGIAVGEVGIDARVVERPVEAGARVGLVAARGHRLRETRAHGYDGTDLPAAGDG